MRLKALHVTVGIATLIAFALTGQYMHWVLGHLRDMPDTPRLLYRSAHIYLLFAGLCNLALGLNPPDLAGTRARFAQGIGSALLVASPVLFAISFFVESPASGIERTVLRLGIYASFGGVLLHAAAAWWTRDRKL